LPGPLGRGPLGVDLFFVISGFLITTLLLHERAHSIGGRIDLGAFWVRRSLRIFPLYYLVLGAFVLHAVFLRESGPVRDHFLASLPFHATYTSNWFLASGSGTRHVEHAIVFAFGWSLATEEQFYALWPPILRASRGRIVPALAMGLLVLADQAVERAWVGSTTSSVEGPAALALRIVRSFSTPIGLGALLALAADHPGARRLLDAVLAQRASSLVALAVVGLAVTVPFSVLTTHLALVALVGAAVLRRDHVLAPVLEHRAVRHVGAVSYGIYLLNVPVVWAVKAALGEAATARSGLVVFLVATAGTVVLASLTHRFVERPFLALRARSRVSRGRGATVSGAEVA